jgi:hypothetical protein
MGMMSANRMLKQTAIAGCVAAMSVIASCGFGPSTFTLNGASVDPTYQCPTGATNSPYELHASIDIRNGTSNTVSIKSVAAVMTLVAVKGTWLEQLGDRYTASNVTFTPSSVGAGANGTMHVTIPSACTNGKTPTSGSGYGEYSVGLTVTTSAGTYTIQSGNRHRIVPA